MISLQSRIGIALAGVAGLCASASGGLPDVLSQMSDETPVAIVIPSIDQLDEGIASMIGALEMPMLVTPKNLIAQAGVQAGLDMTRPVAVFVSKDAIEQGGSGVLLLPTDDFASLVGQFNPTEENGLQMINLMGETTFVRDLGNGYAAAGESADDIAAFAGAGNLGELERSIGKSGAAVAERSDAYAIIRLAPFREEIAAGIAEARGEMANGMGAAAAMAGQDPEELAAQMDMAFGFAESFVNQSEAIVIGADTSAMGLGLEFSSNFTPGSEWAGMMVGGGNASPILGSLPGGDYMMAYAVDYDNPLMGHLFDILGGMNINMMGLPGMEGQNIENILANTDGQAMALYPSPAGLMGGLVTGAVSFTSSKDPAGLRDAMRAAMSGIGEVEAGDNDLGMAMTVELEENAGQIGDNSYDAWSVGFDMGQMGNPMMGQMMMMITGQPDGIRGLVGTNDKGMYLTYSSNVERLESAMNVEAGNSLADDQLIKQVSDRLPSNRIGEFYIGFDAILQQVMPFIQMQMGAIDLGIDGPLPPLGMGVTADDGSMHGAMYVPMPLIKAGANGYMTFQMMQMMQDGGDENPPF